MIDTKGEVRASMEDALNHLREELKQLRTGRANPNMLDSVMVEAYGTNMRLKDLASVSAPEPRQIVITPYDANNAGVIAKGIEAANLNLNPMIDGNVVRINVPQMDESIRKDIVKICKKKGEEAKVAIREVRRKFNDYVRKQKADGEIPEDQMKSEEKMIQVLTDKYCQQVDDACSAKEKEILEI